MMRHACLAARRRGNVARLVSSRNAASGQRRWQHVAVTNNSSSTTSSTVVASSSTTCANAALSASGRAAAQSVLAAYPTFNLNDDGRPRGPRRGDAAILTLSGGVDSSVAAYLAITAGGLIPRRTIFMRNWNGLEEGDGFAPGAGGAQGCQWMKDWALVEKMASWLDVQPELVDLSAAYWNNVFAPSLDAWQRGSTPNPDVLCNREIKFGELLQRLDSQEATPLVDAQPAFGRQATRTWLVTGHYAHLEYFYPRQGDDALLHGKLLRAVDRNKDQSFFLSAVASQHLGRSHFPLAHLPKSDVRRTAHALGMPTSSSKESMGLCFVGPRTRQAQPHLDKQSTPRGKGPVPTQLGFSGFLGDYIENAPGPIVTIDGTRVGTHDGLHTLTVGQGARLGGMTQRFFVAAKDVQTNRIIVVPGNDHPMLFSRSLRMDAFRFIDTTLPSRHDYVRTLQGGSPLYAQIRHRDVPAPCRVTFDNSDSDDDGLSISHRIQVHFDPPLSSVAEGQVCALYAGDWCIGSGVISGVETMASYHHSAGS